MSGLVLSDLQLSLGKQSVTSLDYGKLQVRRGKLVKDGLPGNQIAGVF